MGISFKPEHLKHYKNIAWLLIKYGRSDLVNSAGLDSLIKGEADVLTGESPKAEELASDLEKLGPTFIKLAQLLSSRADLLPVPYLEALARLQDKVEPFSFADVERIVSSELGVRLSKAFLEFEAIPVAAASLGQVHRAALRDGRSVVVKVQRPDIRELIAEDFEVFEDIAEFLDKRTEIGKRYEFTRMVSEFRKTLLRELDYRLEAQNLITIGKNLEEFDRIVVPEPVEDYTTSRVLTMDYIRGKKITALTPLARIEIDGFLLADELFRAYLKQILLDGLFHADPHPGNVFLTDDDRIALIDLGMVGRIAPRRQEDLLKLLIAVSEGQGEEAGELTLRLGEPKQDFDESGFLRRVSELVTQSSDVTIEDIEAGRTVLEISRIAGECGFRLPREYTMVAKTLLNLDQVVATLDPSFQPNESIRKNAAEIMQQRVVKSVSLGSLFSTALETKGFIERLPSRINKLLDTVANNEMQIRVDAIDEHRLMEGLQKIANRITLGLVLASLIVGAALLMRVETRFQILGYPGLAIILFLVAAGGGLLLVLNILFYDEKHKD